MERMETHAHARSLGVTIIAVLLGIGGILEILAGILLLLVHCGRNISVVE
jgi:uncharacterized membrane protein YphA (DoxX/SURF4 family)